MDEGVPPLLVESDVKLGGLSGDLLEVDAHTLVNGAPEEVWHREPERLKQHVSE